MKIITFRVAILLSEGWEQGAAFGPGNEGDTKTLHEWRSDRFGFDMQVDVSK